MLPNINSFLVVLVLFISIISVVSTASNTISHPSSMMKDNTMRRRRASNTNLQQSSLFHVEKPPLSDSTTSSQSSFASFFSSPIRFILLVVVVIYILLFILLCVSRWAQSQLIFLHWISPPRILYPLSNLAPYRLASSARVIKVGHIRGWHLLPPGPPFPTTGSSQLFKNRLAAPNQRVVLFMHGNAGTRAFPEKRVTMIKLLRAHLNAHVFTFDYSGFGDTPGTPSEHQLNLDAREFYTWIANHTHASSDIIIYGQSLGTFPAIGLSVYLSQHQFNSDFNELAKPAALILDAPPASLIDAALTHPVTLVWRFVPRIKQIMQMTLYERFNSEEKIGDIQLPILIIHGEDDGMVSVENGRKLYMAAKKAGNNRARFVGFPNSGHTDVNAQPAYLEVLYTFLKAYLRNDIAEDGISR